jgi:hypothetical protein
MKHARVNHLRRLPFVMAISAGCSLLWAQPPTAGKPEATLHIYRPRLDVGKAAHPTVSCDAFAIARIQNGRVYTMKISPGRHSFTVGGKTDVTNIDVEPGKEYFLRVDYPPNASFAAGAIAVLVDPAQGLKEIRKLRPLDGWFIENATCGKT